MGGSYYPCLAMKHRYGAAVHTTQLLDKPWLDEAIGDQPAQLEADLCKYGDTAQLCSGRLR